MKVRTRKHGKGKSQAPVTKDPRVGTMALWIETPFGPLYPCIRPVKTLKPGETQTLQIRARRREYLDKFRARWCPDAGEVLTGEEVSGHRTDYPYRLYVSPEQFAAAVSAMILKIDSEKFKPLVDGPEGLGDKKLAGELHSAYTACWSDQLRLSDGTSSYDFKSWGTASVPTSPADPESPSPTCRKDGHYFSRSWDLDNKTLAVKIDYQHKRCFDCPAVLDVKANTYSYPNGTAPLPARQSYEPAQLDLPGVPKSGNGDKIVSYGLGYPTGDWPDYPGSDADDGKGTYPCCKHCTTEYGDKDCGEADAHTSPCPLGCDAA